MTYVAPFYFFMHSLSDLGENSEHLLCPSFAMSFGAQRPQTFPIMHSLVNSGLLPEIYSHLTPFESFRLAQTRRSFHAEFVLLLKMSARCAIHRCIDDVP